MAISSNVSTEQITQAILDALSRYTVSPCGVADAHGCTDCQLCAQKCPEHVRQVLDAGAARISARTGVTVVPKDITKFIDHTLLKPEATPAEIEKLCQEAKEYHFAAVCVNPPYIKQCATLLRGTDVTVCAVIGFPLGAHTTEVKVFETRQAVTDGAREIDMVINIGALKAKQYDFVRDDIRAVCDATHAGGAILKVIIEAALLTDDEKVRACELSKEAGADFVKTSTGFGPGGATAHDVALMARTVGAELGVKAAGGIRNYEQAQTMIAAGATRIGASAGVKIVAEARASKQ
ncbi:MAG: deoxyribose-phosphate aldolase [Anaerolineales bacterium]|nr:deoxyribose-phosphate aldolase [Anaerolineales bacterium]